MKAMKILGKGQLELCECPTPVPGPGEVLIQVAASGICGTDVHMYNGQSMGSYPIIPGHEFAGEVVATGPGTSRVRTGDRVAVEPNLSCGNCIECLNNRQHLCCHWQALGVTLPGGMAEYVCAPEAATFAIGDLPCESGAFVEPLSCVLHAVERLSPALGDRILMLGAGPIGLLLMRVLRVYGAAQVDTVELDAGRRKAAVAEGLGEGFAALEETRCDYDVVIDATGVVSVQQQALDRVRAGGVVLYFGVAPEGATFPIEPYKIFRRELKILSSFTSLRNSLQAVRLLSTGRVRVDDLISHRFPLEKLGDAFDCIQSKREPVLKVMICPSGLC